VLTWWLAQCWRAPVGVLALEGRYEVQATRVVKARGRLFIGYCMSALHSSRMSSRGRCTATKKQIQKSVYAFHFIKLHCSIFSPSIVRSRLEYSNGSTCLFVLS
jgi:hypothetical protein